MDMQCQYRSKRCPNVRSLKISGELHRFCIFHRWRANATQRRWVQRKQTGDAESPTDSDTSPSGTPKRAMDMEEPVIKLENDLEPPAPKRRRSDVAKTIKAATKGALTKQPELAFETARIPMQLPLEPQPLPPVARPPTASVPLVSDFPSSMPSSYPLLSEEDFVIFRHLVLETEDHTVVAPKPLVPAAVDVGSCWWDVNYRRKSDGQPSFMV